MGTRPVLLGFAESLPAPEAAFSLLDAGFEVTAFTRRGRRPPLRRARSVRLAELTAPEESAAAAEEDLKRLVREVRPVAVLPVDDAALAISRVSGFALDKRLQLAAAEQAGFSVPATRSLAGASEALAGGLDLPVVLKPALAAVRRDGRLGRAKNFVCADREELERAVGLLPPDEPVLAQRLLHGAGEGLFGFASAGGVVNWSAHRRLRMMNPIGSGASACVSIPVDPELIGPAERLVAGAGWRGMFMVEVLRDPSGRAWFMEFNGRAWGSLALARRLGLEYPAWTAQQALDPAFVPPQVRVDGRNVTCRHLGREILHLMFVLRGPPSTALSDWPSRRGAFAGVCRVSRRDQWYNARPGERALFLDDTIRTVLAPALARIRRP